MKIRVTSRWAGVLFNAVFAIGLAALPAWADKPASGSDSTTPSLKGRYVFRMTPVKSFSAVAPGDPGGVAGAPRQDILRVGFFVSDGAGNLTGHTVATTDTNSGKTWLVVFDWVGKYILNSDGTGYFSVDTLSNMQCTDMTVSSGGPTPHPAAAGGTPALGNVACPTGSSAIEGPEDYAFVLTTVGGRALEFIETDNDGGGAKIFLTGTGRRQDDTGTGDDNSKGNGNGNGNN